MVILGSLMAKLLHWLLLRRETSPMPLDLTPTQPMQAGLMQSACADTLVMNNQFQACPLGIFMQQEFPR